MLGKPDEWNSPSSGGLSVSYVQTDIHFEILLVTQQTHVWYLRLCAKNHEGTGPYIQDYSLSMGKTYFLMYCVKSIMECCTECCRGRTAQFEELRSERESSQGPRADVPLPPLFLWSATRVSPVPRGLLSASHFHENAVLPGYSSRLFVSWHHSVLLPYLLTMPSQSCYGLFVLGLHLNISRVCPSAFFFVVSRWSCSFSWLQLLYGNISQFPSVIFNIKTPVNSRLIHNCLLDISPGHCIASHTQHVHNQIYQSP